MGAENPDRTEDMVSLIHVQAKSDLHREVRANPVFIKTLTSFSQPSVLPFGVDTASANNSVL